MVRSVLAMVSLATAQYYDPYMMDPYAQIGVMDPYAQIGVMDPYAQMGMPAYGAPVQDAYSNWVMQQLVHDPISGATYEYRDLGVLGHEAEMAGPPAVQPILSGQPPMQPPMQPPTQPPVQQFVQPELQQQQQQFVQPEHQ